MAICREGPDHRGPSSSSSSRTILCMIQLVVWLQILTAIFSYPRVSGLEITLSNREGLERASSCRHSVARIEITNTHDHDCLIRSIRLGPETTVQVEPSPILNHEAVQRELPQQFYAADVDQNSLTLAPGQVAAMSLVFMPRFPPRWESAADALPWHLNDWQRADREQWLEPYALRSNQHLATPLSDGEDPPSIILEEYRITSTLLVESEAHGIESLPIEATGVRNNLFGLPDSIYFRGDLLKNPTDNHPPVSEAPSFISQHGARILDRAWKDGSPSAPPPTKPEGSDCYDLFVRHPGEKVGLDPDEPWIVQTVLVSDPDKASLRLSSDYIDVALTVDEPMHVVKNWTSSGHLPSREIPPDGNSHYLATICPTPASERDTVMEEHVKRSLGHWTTSTLSNNSLGFVLVQSDGPILMTELIVWQSKKPERQLESVLREMNLTSSDEETLQTTPRLKSHAKKISIYALASTGGVTKDVIAKVTNTDRRDITIMTASLVFSYGAVEQFESLGVHIQVEPILVNGRWFIAGHETREVVRLNVTIDVEKSKDMANVLNTQEGRLTIQGSYDHSQSDAWLHSIRARPEKDLDAMVDIPVSIYILRGTVGFQLKDPLLGDERLLATSEGPRGTRLVEAAFFPITTGVFWLPNERDDSGMNHTETAISHVLNVQSSLPLPVGIRSVHIIDEKEQHPSSQSFCGQFDISLAREDDLTFEVPGTNLRIGSSSLGDVGLFYNFPADGVLGGGLQGAPSTCQLEIETKPDTGKHRLPLILYSGSITVPSLPALNVTTGDEDRSSTIFSSRDRVKVGYDDLTEWMTSSSDGRAFRSFLTTGKPVGDSKVVSVLDAYLRGSEKVSQQSGAIIRPVLFTAGTVDAGEARIFPLYFENPNPVPVKISLDGSNLDGFQVRLGRDRLSPSDEGKSLSEAIVRTWTKTQGPRWQNSSMMKSSDRIHGQRLESLFHFLKTSDVPRDFLDQFNYRDAVHVDQTTAASHSLISQRRTGISYATFHKRDHATNSAHGSCCPLFRKTTADSPTAHRLVPGLLTVGTGKFTKLCRCPEAKSRAVTLPPAGLARFDVTVTAPSEDDLERDINSFIATGMVMSTELGELVPILVSFEVPRGNLFLSPFSKERHQRNKSSPVVLKASPTGAFFKSNFSKSLSRITVPPKARNQVGFDVLGQRSLSVDSNSDDNGQKLYAMSSFNRNVTLLEVESCNPWFQVDFSTANGTEVDTFLGVNIGTLRYEIPCQNAIGFAGFDSFHACTLNWISKWLELDKFGCGRKGVEENSAGSLDARQQMALAKVHNRVLQISAWSFSSHRGLPSDQRFFDGYIAPALVATSATVANIWGKVHEWDLFTLSTELRAKVERNSSDGVASQQVSLPIRNVTIVSKLTPPSLLDFERHPAIKPPEYPFAPSTIDVPPSLVGTPVAMEIPLFNPTDVPVRVRLATVLREDLAEESGPEFALESARIDEFLTSNPPPYVQGPLYSNLGVDQVNEQWWDGPGSFYFPNFDGDLIRAHHNVSVRAGSHAYVGLVSPSLLSNSAFLYGCGPRCGIRDETAKHDSGRQTLQKTVVGASAATGTTLVGRKRGETAEANYPREPSDILLRAGASIHAAGSGPTAFGIPRSALEEIVVQPRSRAVLGPIFFRPPGRSRRMGSGNSRGGDTFDTMLFLENSMTGLERVLLKGKPLWERVEFSDSLSDEDEEGFSDIELRNNIPALLFPGTLVPPFPTTFAIAKEITLKNTGDIPVSFRTAYLSDRITTKASGAAFESCKFADFHLLNCSLENTFSPVELKPGETTSFLVSHQPSCTKRSQFISLNVEYHEDPVKMYSGASGHAYTWFTREKRANERKWSFRPASETIMIGYDMNPVTFSNCVPWNTKLFPPSPKPMRLLTPVNQTGELRKLARTVREMKVLKQLGLPKMAMFFIYMTLCFIVIIVAAYFFEGRRVAANALDEHNARSRNRYTKNDIQSNSAHWSTIKDDLTPADLELVSLTRVRGQVLPRLKSRGAISPQCVTQTGAFQRDRSQMQAQNSMSVSRERGRTVSEALFRQTMEDSLHGGLLPLNMGWRTAVARGIISEKSFKKIQGQLKTHHLLIQRSRSPKRVLREFTKAEKEPLKARDGSPLADTGLATNEAEDQTSRDTQGELQSEFPEIELASEASDLEFSISEASPNGSSDHKSNDSSSQSGPPGIESIVMATAGSQKEAADSGFKTIRSEKTGKGRSRKGGTKKPQAGSRAKNGSSKMDKTRTGVAKKNKKDGNNNTPSTSSPTLTPTSHVLPMDQPRGWAEVAASTTSAHAAESPSALRSPPGLGPPPGFSSQLPLSPDSLSSPPSKQSEGFALDFSRGFDESRPLEGPRHSRMPSEASSNSGDNAYLPGTMFSQPYLSRDNSVEHMSSLGMLLGGSLPDPEPSEEQKNDEFDVVDFLDGILNDGSANEEEPVGATDDVISSLATRSESVPIGLSSEPAVPANPWAGGTDTTASSRASLYGISLNDNNASRETPDFPLLTPQAILGEGEVEEEELRRSPLFARGFQG